MITILWSALNVAVILGLLYAAVQAIRLLRQRFDWGLAIFFGLGLLLLISRGSSSPTINSTNTNLLGELLPHTPLSNGSATLTFALGGGLHLTLLAEYNQQDNMVKPRGLYSVISGIVVGHSWCPIAGSAEQVGQQLRCLAVLEHKWLLLGVPIFSKTQEYVGLMTLRKPAV